jgi:hypothetical protein
MISRLGGWRSVSRRFGKRSSPDSRDPDWTLITVSPATPSIGPKSSDRVTTGTPCASAGLPRASPRRARVSRSRATRTPTWSSATVTRRDRCLERKSRRVQLPPGLAGDEDARVEQPTTERSHDRPIGSRSSVVSPATRARSARSPGSACAMPSLRISSARGSQRRRSLERGTSAATRLPRVVITSSSPASPPQQGSRVIAQLSSSDLGTHATTVAVA